MRKASRLLSSMWDRQGRWFMPGLSLAALAKHGEGFDPVVVRRAMAGMKRSRVFRGFPVLFRMRWGVRVGVAPEETAVLVGWRKRPGSRVLAGMKAEAVLHASRGVDAGIIAGMVERTERTVQEWPAEWRATRMRSVLTGHAGNQNAAKLTRARREDLKAILARPPSQTGIHAGSWDVPAVREVVKIMFDVEYQADSSHRLLLRFCGPSLEPPGPVRRAPQRESRHQTHDRGENPSQGPVGRRLGGLHGRRGPPRARGLDPPHAAPKRGQRTRPSVNRQRTSQSFFGALPRPTKKSNCTRSRGAGTPSRQSSRWNDSNAKPTEKIAVVPDNARFHHAKALTGLHQPGQLLERITPIHLPPYAPDHNPVEHVRNTARNNTATIQHETPEETLGASASHIASRTFDYDFEHLPLRETRNDLVS